MGHPSRYPEEFRREAVELYRVGSVQRQEVLNRLPDDHAPPRTVLRSPFVPPSGATISTQSPTQASLSAAAQRSTVPLILSPATRWHLSSPAPSDSTQSSRRRPPKVASEGHCKLP